MLSLLSQSTIVTTTTTIIIIIITIVSITIINNSSIAAIRYGQGAAIYSAAKVAVTHYTKLAGVELGPHNIRVNSIAPGAIQAAVRRPHKPARRCRVGPRVCHPLSGPDCGPAARAAAESCGQKPPRWQACGAGA